MTFLRIISSYCILHVLVLNLVLGSAEYEGAEENISCAHKCNASYQYYCLHGGECCFYKENYLCNCPQDYEGDRCQYEKGPDESKKRQLQLTLFSSIISLLLTAVVLGVLIFVIVYTIKNSKKRKEKMLQNIDELDKEILYVKEELGKLSPEEKNSKLARLSKMIEATARAALITFPALVTPPQKNPNNLPTFTSGTLAGMRSNSAPTVLCEVKATGPLDNGPEKVSMPARGFTSVRFSRPSIRKFFSNN